MSNLRRFIPSRDRLPQVALFLAPALIGIWVLIAAVRAGVEWVEVRKLIRTYTDLTGVRPETAAGTQPTARDEMVKRMSSHRLIAPPQSIQLTGVLGDQAIFNGSMLVKAGGSAGDMQVVSVGPNWVKVSKNGSEQQLWVFQPTLGISSPQGGNPSEPEGTAAAKQGQGGRRSGAPTPVTPVQP